MTGKLFIFLALAFILAGCAGLDPRREPLRISVAGIEPLEGQGMEARFAVRLRIQNHADQPLAYDGIALDLDLSDARFGSGVSDQQGTVPRFGETIITVPVTVPATAIIHHIFSLATGNRVRTDYRLRGELGGAEFTSGKFFDISGEITLPTTPPEKTP
jgi:LEA14-like dessication related protein